MDQIAPAGLAEAALASWAEGQTNAALRSWDDVVVAEELVSNAGLPLHPCRPKTWDTYLALFHITRGGRRPGPVLDAGAERYSALLPALAKLDYTDLTGVNLAFGLPEQAGQICYEHGDITATRFADGAFSAITSLSVIEHGVDTAKFFQEASRLLAPGGILFVSFNYWHEPVDVRGQTMYGAPVQIFGPGDWARMLNEASAAGLIADGVPNFRCGEQVIHWPSTGLDYTFANILLRKPESDAKPIVKAPPVPRFLGSGGETCAFLNSMFPEGVPETFRAAEIGVWEGETTLALAAIMNNRGRLDLFDYEDVVAKVVARLAGFGFTNAVGHGNSYKTLDSYNWPLMKLLAQHDQPVFDYIYLDGSHSWAIDGFAFCLLDRLLKPGGFIDFDDYGWTYARSPGGNPVVRPATAVLFTGEQIATPQVDLIVNLLVRRDPRFQEIVANKIFLKTRL